MRTAAFFVVLAIAIGSSTAAVAQGVSLFVNWPRYGYDHRYVSTYGYGAPLVVGYGFPGLAYPYGGYSIGYGWPYYLDGGTRYLGTYIAPPVYVPAEQLGFGPQAVRRFMGVEPARRTIVHQNIIVAPPAADGNAADRGNRAENGVNAARLRVRQSNAEARRRALQFLQFGDEQFAARNLAGAYERYKKAAVAAPDLAEPYFREGHAFADMGRYEQAAAAFRRGLNLRPDWPSSGFRLAQIYRDQDAARLAALDALKRAAEAEPDDQDVQFAAGVQYFFDGQNEMAASYFERAKALGEPAAYVEPFLKPPQNGGEDADLDI